MHTLDILHITTILPLRVERDGSENKNDHPEDHEPSLSLECSNSPTRPGCILCIIFSGGGALPRKPFRRGTRTNNGPGRIRFNTRSGAKTRYVSGLMLGRRSHSGSWSAPRAGLGSYPAPVRPRLPDSACELYQRTLIGIRLRDFGEAGFRAAQCRAGPVDMESSLLP